MAKYNFLDDTNTNPFEDDKGKKEERKKNEREFDSGKLFDSDDQPEININPENQENLSPPIEDKQKTEFKEEESTVIHDETSVPPPETLPDPPIPGEEKPSPPILEDYEDQKIEGINFKPIFIGGGIVVALIVIFFVVRALFFGGEPAEEPVAEPEVPAVDPVMVEKLNTLQSLIIPNRSVLNNFYTISKLRTENTSFASILLYENSFKFEVFGKSRDDIARFNMNVKNNNLRDKYEISTVENRPGSKGGLFAFYTMKGSIGGGEQNIQPEINENIENKLKSVFANQNINIKSEREIRTNQNINRFTKKRVEYILTGTYSNCFSTIQILSDSGENFTIHKLSMVARNQQDIVRSDFQMLIVIDYFL